MATSAAVPALQLKGSLRETTRLASVDVLRGLVMVIMALDHTRDFFSNSAAMFEPTDLSRTTPLLFFTRWITHFCAPIFVLLAGSGAYLSIARGKDKRELSKFLISRGLWLIFLEIFVVSPFGWSFSLSFGFRRLQVIWVIGASMVLLGALIRLWPSRIIGGVGIAMILTHNIFDGARAAWFGEAAGAWKVLHQITFFEPWPHKIVASLYPLIPWAGVLMAGYAAGELLTLAAARRRRVLLWLGGMLTVLFVALRASNVYGDPSPWSVQADPIYSVMSFLRCSKYPPSFLYLLMTLGPALIVLALTDDASGWLLQRFRDFGRVPLFYYLLHLPLLHGAAVLFSLAAYGNASWLYQDLMGLKGSPHPLPTGYGYSLPVVYAVWLVTVLALYPACRWFASVKKNRREAIFSYL
jgi:uncharacterized membrane protein